MDVYINGKLCAEKVFENCPKLTMIHFSGTCYSSGISIKNSMILKQQGIQTHYKLDHHWTTRAAYEAYKKYFDGSCFDG